MGEASIGELVSRLIDSGKAYVHAEIALLRQTGLAWFARARVALVLVVVAIFIVQAALTVLIAALGMTLAHWLGTAGGLALGAVIGLAVAGLLAWLAVRKLVGDGK